MTSLSLKTRNFLHPNNSTLHFLPQNKLQSIEFSKKVKVKTKITCSATDQPQKKYSKKKRSASEEDKGIDPVGFLMKLGISHKVFAQFLRERHKALKDLKAEIFKRFLNLQELSTGYEIVGVHRNPEHRMDFMDWAPGARYCALVGDFNGWSPTENCAREGHFGHDDYGYWFISLEDKLARLHTEIGRLAWGVNPTNETKMIGTQAIICRSGCQMVLWPLIHTL